LPPAGGYLDAKYGGVYSAPVTTGEAADSQRHCFATDRVKLSVTPRESHLSDFQKLKEIAGSVTLCTPG